MVKLSQLIAPAFFGLHNDIRNEGHTHYWLKGGRGSTKSSFISLEIIQGMMRNADANAIALRKVKDTLKDSVFAQLIWAIEELGVSDYWQTTLSPLRLTYIPTGQRIIFRGLDSAKKIKSVKVSKGYLRYIWFEELEEFTSMEEIRNVRQSLIRGGNRFEVFYSYNPPKSITSWVNAETAAEHPDRIVHHSDYRTVPPEWLGEDFIRGAEHLKAVNPDTYAHEYLGEVTGTGGENFANVKSERITDSQIAAFDNIRRGMDYGYAVDPFAYIAAHYDKTRRRLYIYREIYKTGLSNAAAVKLIQAENKLNQPVTADSAEPKSIDEMRGLGLRVFGARKGPDSVDYGIRWLQSLEKIIIDPMRCPNTYGEFTKYEFEADGHGGFKAKYPDKNNHTIDAVRYACEDDMRRPAKVITVKGI